MRSVRFVARAALTIIILFFDQSWEPWQLDERKSVTRTEIVVFPVQKSIYSFYMNPYISDVPKPN